MISRYVSFLFLAMTACSSASGPAAPSDVSKFLGTWTYRSGSAIFIDCPGATEQTIDLSKTPPDGQPGYFTFSAEAGGEIHEVDARGCNYDWTVSGDVATARENQSCANFPDGHGGSRVVHMQSGTKSTSDGSSMAVEVRFTTDAPASCAIKVAGVAGKP